MLRIFPYAGVQFLVFERAKRFYRSHLGDNHLVSFAAGSTAGVTAVSCTYPVDFLRARMAYTVGKDQGRSLRVTARHIYQTEGLATFYQGVYPTILGMVFYAGFSFGIYDYLKHAMLEYEYFQGSSDQHLSTVSNLVCGGLAGTISQTIAYPLDVVRRRMQLEHRPKGPDQSAFKYNGIAQTLRLLYAENGVRTLWRGVTLNYAREFPQVGRHVCLRGKGRQLDGHARMLDVAWQQLTALCRWGLRSWSMSGSRLLLASTRMSLKQ